MNTYAQVILEKCADDWMTLGIIRQRCKLQAYEALAGLGDLYQAGLIEGNFSKDRFFKILKQEPIHE